MTKQQTQPTDHDGRGETVRKAGATAKRAAWKKFEDKHPIAAAVLEVVGLAP